MSSTEHRPKRRRSLLFISAAVLLITLGLMIPLVRMNDDFISHLGVIFTILGAIFTIYGVLVSLHPRVSPSTYTTSTPLPAKELTNKHHDETDCTEIDGVTSATLGLNKGMGAIIVFTNSTQFGTSISLVFGFDRSSAEADIIGFVGKGKAKSRTIYFGIFGALPAGNYIVRLDTVVFEPSVRRERRVTIHAGKVIEIDWRQRTRKRTSHGLMNQEKNHDEA